MAVESLFDNSLCGHAVIERQGCLVTPWSWTLYGVVDGVVWDIVANLSLMEGNGDWSVIELIATEAVQV